MSFVLHFTFQQSQSATEQKIKEKEKVKREHIKDTQQNALVKRFLQKALMDNVY